MQDRLPQKPIFPMRLASFVSWIFNGVGSVLCSVLWRATFPISVASPTDSMPHNSMPVDYRCTAQHTIGSISGFFIEIGFHGSFGYQQAHL